MEIKKWNNIEVIDFWDLLMLLSKEKNVETIMNFIEKHFIENIEIFSIKWGYIENCLTEKQSIQITELKEKKLLTKRNFFFTKTGFIKFCKIFEINNETKEKILNCFKKGSNFEKMNKVKIFEVGGKRIIKKEINGKPIMTLWDMGLFYNKEVKRITEIFKSNQKRLEIGKDYEIINREDFFSAFFIEAPKNSRKEIFLLFKSGFRKIANRIQKKINKKIFEKILNEYFNVNFPLEVKTEENDNFEIKKEEKNDDFEIKKEEHNMQIEKMKLENEKLKLETDKINAIANLLKIQNDKRPFDFDIPKKEKDFNITRKMLTGVPKEYYLTATDIVEDYNSKNGTNFTCKEFGAIATADGIKEDFGFLKEEEYNGIWKERWFYEEGAKKKFAEILEKGIWKKKN